MSIIVVDHCIRPRRPQYVLRLAKTKTERIDVLGTVASWISGACVSVGISREQQARGVSSCNEPSSISFLASSSANGLAIVFLLHGVQNHSLPTMMLNQKVANRLTAESCPHGS
jgi:hypothetical protein